MALALICEPIDDQDGDDLATCADCGEKFAETNEEGLCDECEDEYQRQWGGLDARREWGTW